MPKIEFSRTFFKINGNPFCLNALNYQISNNDSIGFYYDRDRDRRILKGTNARFDDWTDLNDAPYTSFSQLISDVDKNIFYTGTSEDYFLNVAMGEIDGASGFGLVGVSDSIGEAEGVVGGMTGRYPFQTSSVSLEAVSDSSNDTSSGTGARTIQVRTLDADYNQSLTTIVTMNGTTPVVIPTSRFRVNQSETLTAGSGGKNTGKISIRVAGGGDVLSVIKPGDNVSRDAAITSPAGFTAFLWTTVTLTNKGNDANVKVYRRPENGLFLLRAPIPTYQNSFTRNLKIPIRIDEKTDFEITATATNESTKVTVIQEFELKDNSTVNSSVSVLVV